MNTSTSTSTSISSANAKHLPPQTMAAPNLKSIPNQSDKSPVACEAGDLNLARRFQRALPNFQWTLDEDHALRAWDRRGNVYTPITALCMFETQQYYPSLEYHYAASEINIDQSLAIAIERLSDNFNPNPNPNNKGNAEGVASLLRFLRYRLI